MLFGTGVESFLVQVHREENPSFANSIDRISRYVFPAAFFGVMVLLVLVAFFKVRVKN